MSKLFAYFLSVGFLVPVLIGTSQAQDSEGAPRKEIVIENPPSVLTDAFARTIGELGRKTPIRAATQTTVAEVIERACGTVQPNFVIALQVANADPAIELSTILEPGSELLLPPCPPSSQLAAVEKRVQPGDNFEAYWKTLGSDLPAGNFSRSSDSRIEIHIGDGGTEPPTRSEAFEALADEGRMVALGVSGVEPESVNFADLARAVNAGKIASLNTIVANQTVLVPTVVRPTFGLPLSDEVAADPATQAAALERINEIAEGSDAQVRDELKFYGAIDPRACKSGYSAFNEETENYILRLAAENRSLLADNSFAAVSVMILDSGLYDQVDLPGRTQVFPLRGNTAESRKAYRPFDFHRDRLHGTEVASVAIGGTDMAELLSSMGMQPQITPVNIFTSRRDLAQHEGEPLISGGTVPEITVEYIDRSLVADALGFRASEVVNMSFGGAGDTTIIPDADDGPSSPTLFVVAAGNDGKSLDETDFYPASAGGPNSPSVLTVASIDSDDTLSWFSNWSPDRVDLAAPGCKVPVLRFESNPAGLLPAEGTGTSYSAPYVAWVASLISGAVRKTEPRGSSIKQRLLASADILPHLHDKVAHGRVLNAKKALSLSKDVVEVGPGNAPVLRRGLLEPDAGSPATYCVDPPSRSVPLIKVVPGFDGSQAVEGTTWLNFARKNGTVEAVKCRSKPFALDLQVASGGVTETIKSQDVRDIVFRW